MLGRLTEQSIVGFDEEFKRAWSDMIVFGIEKGK